MSKVGEVIDGVIAGDASDRGPSSGAGGGAGGVTLDSAGSDEFELSCPLSRFMPILTVPSTITTTLGAHQEGADLRGDTGIPNRRGLGCVAGGIVERGHAIWFRSRCCGRCSGGGLRGAARGLNEIGRTDRLLLARGNLVQDNF